MLRKQTVLFRKYFSETHQLDQDFVADNWLGVPMACSSYRSWSSEQGPALVLPALFQHLQLIFYGSNIVVYLLAPDRSDDWHVISSLLCTSLTLMCFTISFKNSSAHIRPWYEPTAALQKFFFQEAYDA